MSDLFSRYVECENISFKHAKGVSDRSGKEFHTFNEIILFLGGDAQLITETIHTKLQPNTLIVIPKETYHQVLIGGQQENYHRCVINFDCPEGLEALIRWAMDKQVIIDVDTSINYLFKKIIDNIDHNNAKEILRSVLTLLLSEIENKKSNYITESSQNPIISSAIKFINDNIRRKITINEIAKACNISESSLSHLFKRDMNTPLHKFIIKKRLISAYHKISLGEAATTVAIECGFNDYSGFYKQYKKLFGFSPSQKNNGR